MKVLLATDGSTYSEMAMKALMALHPPPETEVTVMTVVPENTYLGGITLHMIRGDAATRKRATKDQERKAAELVEAPADALKALGLRVETAIARGSPAEQIIKRASATEADLVAIGAKGTDDSGRFPLGSVAHKVLKYAETSVLLAREATTRIRRLMLATDGSKHSEAAARFLIDIPLPKESKVMLVTSLQSHVAALMKMPTLDLETNQKILAELRAAEEEAARKLMDKTKKQFQAKGYSTEALVLRGDPAEEIIMASKTLNPDLIALGARGLTGIDTFLLGSVAQRVARHSRYSILVVRS